MIGFRSLDRVLRGDATQPETLSREGLAIPVWPVLRVVVLLALVYGLCMGTYGIARPRDPQVLQLIATTAKLPALFLLTLLVTFPSLYVFNTLLGSRLPALDLLRLVICALGVLLAVLASLAPIVAFFSITTTSYGFVVLLNVAVFTVAGGFGMNFLHRTLVRLASRPPAIHPTEPVDVEPPAVEPPRAARVPAPPVESNRVFYVWMAVFGLVGAQMGWVLRPFIGSPEVPFTWFRPREASFLEGVIRSLRSLFGS
jgi:hypothetical protein